MWSSLEAIGNVVNVDYHHVMSTTMSVEETAARLGVKIETVYAYVSRGALTSHRVAGTRRSGFDRDEVEALARRGRPRRTTRPSAVDFTIETRLTSIDARGLRFRDHDAVELSTTKSFEEVAELLWTGRLPDARPHWSAMSLDMPATPTTTDALRVALALAPAGDPLRGDLRPDAVVATARSLVATLVESLPVLGDVGRVGRRHEGRGGDGRRGDGRRGEDSRGEDRRGDGRISERLWVRLTTTRPSAPLVGVLDAALVLLSDHELAASTFAARIAASTRSDPYAVVLAGLGPVAGPLHGGASRAARRLFDDASRRGVTPALATAVEVHGLVPGFGHRLYRDGDPRAVALLDRLRRAAGRTRSMAVVDDVIEEMRRRPHVHPNVDAALAALGMVTSMPVDAGEAIFTVARSAGWIAHAIEEYAEAPVRFRPRALYVGEPAG
jgi:citrate synthase